MRCRIAVMLMVVAIIYSSCGKEISREQEVDPPVVDSPIVNIDSIPLPENGGLLKKIVMKYEGDKDSMVFKFAYDSNNRLIEYYGISDAAEMEDGTLVGLRQQFHRNEKGIVDLIKLQTYLYDNASDSPELHWDGNYKVYYDETNARYKYAQLTGTGESDALNDSLVYEYNSGNRISAVSTYHVDITTGVQPGDKYDYIYDAQGNIKKWSASFVRNYPDREEWFANEFAYDNKTNPGNFGQEVLLTGEIIMLSLPTTNNIITCNNAVDPDDNYTIQYSYNTHDKPTIATWKYITGETMILKYYYQK